MTKEEIKKRIEKIEYNQFLLAMKDHWNRKDYEADDKMYTEIIELRKKLLN